MNNNLKKTPSSIECGKRLKVCRLLTDLTRAEIQKKYNVNSNTLGSIENGDNNLTKKRAQQLVNIFNKEGLAIKLEWLLYGEGDLTIKGNSPKKISFDQVTLDKELSFFEEIKFFKDKNPNAFVSMVLDESLYPLFNKGDYVGGVKTIDPSCIQKLVGEFCLILTDKKQLLVAKIFQYDSKTDLFTIGGINPRSLPSTPNPFQCKIREAGKITRHWSQEIPEE